MRGRFLRNIEEKVTVTMDRDDGTNTIENLPVIIVPDRTPRLTPEGFVVQDLRYIGNITPPNFQIRINDLVTRFGRTSTEPRGSSNEDIQVLTIEDIQVVPRLRGTDLQQLQLRDHKVR